MPAHVSATETIAVAAKATSKAGTAADLGMGSSGSSGGRSAMICMENVLAGVAAAALIALVNGV